MKKHIYIYSPSGAVRDKAAFRRGVARLTALGHEVEIDAAALTRFQRFAGDDATRVAAIHRAAASGANIALISRGGYGLTRILGDLRYKTLAKAIDRGTHFVGISDFTAFQLALLAKTGQVSWAGPALCEGFGGTQAPDEIMQACFEDLLAEQGEGTGWRGPPPRAASAMESVAGNAHSVRAGDDFGEKNCTLWGGNLTVLCGLLGTPYFPTVKNGILFLEDTGEHPYQIERLLTQLLLAGVLARQKAILLGQFTGYKLTSHDCGYTFNTVVNWLRGKINKPVLANLPYGHVATKVLLPVGAKTELLVQGREALLIWGDGAY